ncbi:teneurin-2-like [Leucoraja erinacea]|uniref:teneurin-2-like n=1 Tax=Leucoraja erinaceus TaxID=7782 RepID=UPI0024590282|nr:teneurin-2-like [Leucoraja erinacea]
MDVKDRRHRSLTRGRCAKDCRYTSSSLDSEECRVPTQKSYSSSETLKAYDHDARLHYGTRVTELVHREADEFSRQGANFTLTELGICEPSPHHSTAYGPDMGLLHRGYSLSDADSDTEGAISPEHAIRLWGRGIKSRRGSGLSSRENSALTLTDSENEKESEEEEGTYAQTDSQPAVSRTAVEARCPPWPPLLLHHRPRLSSIPMLPMLFEGRSFLGSQFCSNRKKK